MVDPDAVFLIFGLVNIQVSSLNITFTCFFADVTPVHGLCFTGPVTGPAPVGKPWLVSLNAQSYDIFGHEIFQLHLADW